jgi:hypothetical protein
MTRRFLFSLTAMLALSSLIIACGDGDDVVPGTDAARLRVIHASHDGPAVNVSVDGTQAIKALAFGKSSGFLSVEAGSRTVVVTTTTGTELINTTLPLSPGQDYTVYAVNRAASIEAVVSTDARTPVADKAKVRFIHASFDAPAVDIKLNNNRGPVVFQNVAFKSGTDYLEVDAGSYNFVVTPAGQNSTVVAFDPATLEAGKVYTVTAIGTIASGDNHPFTVRVFVDNGSGSSSVDLMAKGTTPKKAMAMVIHGSPDAPGVDLLVDNNKVNSAPLTFPNNTGYLSLDAGKRNIKVNVASSGATAIEADLEIKAGTNYSIFAANRVAKIEAVVLTDDLTAPAKGKAHVRFVHLSADAPAVDIVAKGAGKLFSKVKFKKGTEFMPVDAGKVTLEVQLSSSGAVALTVPNVDLEAGKIYTIWAKGLVADSSLGAEIIVNK